MVRFKRVDIETPYLASLCWHGDDVLDILGLGRTYRLDGTTDQPSIARAYAYKFDAVISHKGHAVLYESHGTKALVVELGTGSDIRELNRHYYHADDYSYPVELFSLPDGREVIAHCPQEYCSLEIEDTVSGQRLTKRDSKPQDVFHSNLEASLDGRYLLDRGWVWQPVNILGVYDVEKALKEPAYLDSIGVKAVWSCGDRWEPETATFCEHKLVHSSFLEYGIDEEEEEFEIKMAEEGVPEKVTRSDKVRRIMASEVTLTDKDGNPVDLGDTRKRPPGVRHILQVHDLDTGKLLSTREMPEFLGRMMPVGDSHVVSFYDHPKLIEISTGKVVHRWEDMFAGPEISEPSAMTRPKGKHSLALDPANRRFAIGKDGQVSIVAIGKD